ncbi:MAG: hypothetical protein ACLT98_03590 [Eggerthellaceae bacterium]
MKTKVEVLESGATKLTVTIEAAEIDARIKKTYKDFGAKYRFTDSAPAMCPSRHRQQPRQRGCSFHGYRRGRERELPSGR